MNIFHFNHYSLFQPNRRLWRFDDPPTPETNPNPEKGEQTLQTGEAYPDDPFEGLTGDTNNAEEKGLEEQKQCIGSCQDNLSNSADENGTGGGDPELTLDLDKYKAGESDSERAEKEGRKTDIFDDITIEEETGDEPAEKSEKLDEETKTILMENFTHFLGEAMKVVEDNPSPFSQWVKLSGFDPKSESGKTAINKGLDAFINNLTEEELADIKADPESFSFEGQELRMGTLILKSAGLSEKEIESIKKDPKNAQEVLLNFLKEKRLAREENPNEKPLTEEEVLATLRNPEDTEGLQELAERLGEFFSVFIEYYNKGDYSGMIDVFEVGIMEKRDPTEVEKESKQKYIDTLKDQELDVNTLVSIITNPRGKEADGIFGENIRFRKGAEEAGLLALAEKLDITKINTVKQEGEETIIEYNSKNRATLTQNENLGTQVIVEDYTDGGYKRRNIQEPEIMDMVTSQVFKNPEDTDGDPTTAHLTEGGDLTDFLKRNLKVG